MEMIGYGTVRRLLQGEMQVDNLDDFYGFYLKEDGIWLAPPPRDEWPRWLIPPVDDRHRYRYEKHDYDLEDGNLVERPSVPAPFEDHDYSKPVLAFPCSQEKLRAFLVRSGLDAMISPDHEVLQVSQSPFPNKKQKIEEIEKENLEKAKNYALEERAKGTPETDLLLSLESKYDLDGATLHDVLRPEKTDKTPKAKRKAMFDLRKKSKSNAPC